jgi:hypothetical protein
MSPNVTRTIVAMCTTTESTIEDRRRFSSICTQKSVIVGEDPIADVLLSPNRAKLHGADREFDEHVL